MHHLGVTNLTRLTRAQRDSITTTCQPLPLGRDWLQVQQEYCQRKVGWDAVHETPMSIVALASSLAAFKSRNKS